MGPIGRAGNPTLPLRVMESAGTLVGTRLGMVLQCPLPTRGGSPCVAIMCHSVPRYQCSLKVLQMGISQEPGIVVELLLIKNSMRIKGT